LHDYIISCCWEGSGWIWSWSLKNKGAFIDVLSIKWYLMPIRILSLSWILHKILKTLSLHSIQTTCSGDHRSRLNSNQCTSPIFTSTCSSLSNHQIRFSFVAWSLLSLFNWRLALKIVSWAFGNDF
jgi:hypothetical protein